MTDNNAAEVRILVRSNRSDSDAATLFLDDERGNTGGANVQIDMSRTVESGGEVLTWDRCLRRYVSDELGSAALEAFGDSLFDHLIGSHPELLGAWRAAQNGGEVALTLEFDTHSHRFFELPWELLRDRASFVFARPGSALTRALLDVPVRPFEPVESPRVAVATACPPLSGDSFDPQLHIDGLREEFGEDNVEVLRNASIGSIGKALGERPADYLEILAHGFSEPASGVCLDTGDGGADLVSAQVLAQCLGGLGLRLVFLCSCRTAKAGRQVLGGVGQQLVAAEGGNIPCVVATQANLPVTGSAELVRGFFGALRDRRPPAIALAQARSAYKPLTSGAWSVPVLLMRPPRGEARERVDRQVRETRVLGLPDRRSTYVERPTEAEVMDGLGMHRLVTLIGLPGIGKTEVGLEVARRSVAEGHTRLIFQSVSEGFQVRELRQAIAARLGVTQDLEGDTALADLLSEDGSACLIYLDNVEDMMLDDPAQAAFQDFLNALLAGAPTLRILMTSRWASRCDGERTIEVPSMEPEEISDLLEHELRQRGVLQPGWAESEAWREIVAFIDGHPRTLALLASQVSDQLPPQRLVESLTRHNIEAVATPEVFGRADEYARLSDRKRQRLNSLVTSLDLSFDVLLERDRQAAEDFAGLSLFPAGLPEEVALAVTDWPRRRALYRLLDFNLIQWQQERVFFPVPLRWYADRKRSQFTLDEKAYLDRAIEGYCEFAERLHVEAVRGGLARSMSLLLPELETLALLSLDPRDGDVARLATAAQNMLLVASRTEEARRLCEAGLKQAVSNDDRLGEANCLQSLGDLKLRESDLSGARADYDAALPIFREIRERLGEANCLQSLALLRAGEDAFGDAFDLMRDVLRLHQDVDNALGIQSALGYLARIAAQAGQLERALVLAERSLEIGREINDRFGQIISLNLQVVCLGQLGNSEAAVGACVVAAATGLSLEQFPIMHQLVSRIAAEGAIDESEAEDARRSGIAKAKESLEAAGIDPLDPI